MRPLLPLAVAAGIAALLLPLTFPTGGGPTGLDRWAYDSVDSVLGGRDRLLSALAEPSELSILLPLVLIGVAYFAFRRDRRAVLLLIAGPLLAVALNSWLLKPLYDREMAGHLVYPSGHTVSIIAVVIAFALLTTSALRLAVLVLGLVATCCAAIGMIGLRYHHLTDIIGGVGIGFAAVALVSVVATLAAGGWHGEGARRLRRDRRNTVV